jgi:predicted nucleic acid-binding protein
VVPNRSTQEPLVYADTAVWISSLQGEAGHEISDSLFRAAAAGQIRLVANWLLRAELIKPPSDAVDDDIVEMIERILDNEQIIWVELDRFVARESLKIARNYGLSGADAVHLGTAVRQDADFFMSFDRKFPYGQRVGQTFVTRPVVVWQQNIFDIVEGESPRN